jgi:hypothetical protein
VQKTNDGPRLVALVKASDEFGDDLPDEVEHTESLDDLA